MVKNFDSVNSVLFGEGYAKNPDTIRISKNVSISFSNRNDNESNDVVAIGGSASGKTNSLILPNLMKASGSYIVVDPYGDMLKRSHEALLSHGYTIRIIDISNPQHSDRYNPLCYLKKDNENSVYELVDCLLENTDPKKREQGHFWNMAEAYLLYAVFFYLSNHCSEDKRTLSEAYRLCTLASQRDGEFDKIFEALRQKDDKDLAVQNYHKFCLLSEKTMFAVSLSAAMRLKDFDVDSVNDVSYGDTVQLETIGDKKTAIFLLGCTGTNKQSVLVPMFCMQAFCTLFFHANCCARHHLNEHVTFMLDELVNIGYIPSLSKCLSMGIDHNMSSIMVIPSVGVFKQAYGAEAMPSLELCEATVIFGSVGLFLDKDTVEYVNNCLKADRVRREDVSGVIDPVLLGESRAIKNDACLIFTRGRSAMVDEKCYLFA